MKKLKSGHEIVPLTEEENEEVLQYFPAYTNGNVRLNPGGWFLPPAIEQFGDKIYDFKHRMSDVVIMTWAKCGTTWTQEIVWTMIHNPNFDNPKSELPVMIRSPFMELDVLTVGNSKSEKSDKLQESMIGFFKQMCPGKNPQDGIFIQLAENTPEPRVLKTHLAFSVVSPTLLDTCKVIYVARNPKDVLLSYLHHHRLLNIMKFNGDLDTFIDFYTTDRLFQSPYWLHLNEAWAKIGHPNLHWIFYEDMKSNPMKEMHRINEFLDTKLSDDELHKIMDYTKFDSMKKRDPMFSGFSDGKTNFMTDDRHAKEEGNFFRKGVAGDWKESLSEEQNKRLDDWIKKNNVLNVPFKYEI